MLYVWAHCDPVAADLANVRMGKWEDNGTIHSSLLKGKLAISTSHRMALLALFLLALLSRSRWFWATAVRCEKVLSRLRLGDSFQLAFNCLPAPSSSLCASYSLFLLLTTSFVPPHLSLVGEGEDGSFLQTSPTVSSLIPTRACDSFKTILDYPACP